MFYTKRLRSIDNANTKRSFNTLQFVIACNVKVAQNHSSLFLILQLYCFEWKYKLLSLVRVFDISTTYLCTVLVLNLLDLDKLVYT